MGCGFRASVAGCVFSVLVLAGNTGQNSLTAANGDEVVEGVMPGESPYFPGERAFLRSLQHTLSSIGMSFDLSHTLEAYRGRYHGQTDRAARGLSDLTVRWKLPRLLPGASVVAKYSGYSETAPAKDPTLQGFSSLSTEKFRKWQEAYLEAPIGSRVRVKAGKVDANTEFAVIDNGADFSNASAGVNPALFSMPSYPDGAPSLNVFVGLMRGVRVSAGLFQPAGGGTYAVGEADVTFLRKRPVRLASGYWSTQSEGLAAAAVPELATSGTYFIYEQTVLPLEDGEHGLHVFARLSTADKAVAPASRHLAFGLNWVGVRPGKEDSIGFASFRADVAGEAGRSIREQVYEFYYQVPLNNFVTVKADIERVQHPFGLTGTGGTVASVRLLVNLSSQSMAE